MLNANVVTEGEPAYKKDARNLLIVGASALVLSAFFFCVLGSPGEISKNFGTPAEMSNVFFIISRIAEAFVGLGGLLALGGSAAIRGSAPAPVE